MFVHQTTTSFYKIQDSRNERKQFAEISLKIESIVTRLYKMNLFVYCHFCILKCYFHFIIGSFTEKFNFKTEHFHLLQNVSQRNNENLSLLETFSKWVLIYSFLRRYLSEKYCLVCDNRKSFFKKMFFYLYSKC